MAEYSALVVIFFTLLTALFQPTWTLFPLTAFVVLCLIAPFLPRFGFYLPIISRGLSGRRAVALTFDDGPDPQTTPMLMDLLDRYKVTATFFVTGERVRTHPVLVRKILRMGHTLGNHSYSHDPFVMFKGFRRIEAEIQSTQEALQTFGVMPLIFRPPVGITYPGLGHVLKRLNLYTVNFSCRAFDCGNRRIKGLAARILKDVKADDIIMLHDVAPPQSEDCGDWLTQVEAVLAGLKRRGLQVLPLAELTCRPISEPDFTIGTNRPETSHFMNVDGFETNKL